MLAKKRHRSQYPEVGRLLQLVPTLLTFPADPSDWSRRLSSLDHLVPNWGGDNAGMR